MYVLAETLSPVLAILVGVGIAALASLLGCAIGAILWRISNTRKRLEEMDKNDVH